MMKRCVVIDVESIDIGMSIKKELDALMMAIRCCMMKRCLVMLVSSIDIGMSIKKRVYLCGRSKCGSLEESLIELRLGL